MNLMGKSLRIIRIPFSSMCGLWLLILLLPWGNVAGAPSTSAGTDFSPRSGAAAEAATLQNSCPVATTITGQLNPLTSPTQESRLFRDGMASTCAGKDFPGIFNPGGLFRYESFGPYENFGSQDACVVVTYNPFGTGGCGANAHLVAYLNIYDPANQSTNYLGDVGSSAAQPFSFTVPAGDSFLLVAQNTVQSFTTCNLSFTITQVPCQTQSLIEIDPITLSETLLQDTVLSDTLTITNHGLPDLNWSISASVPWVSATPAAGVTPGNSSLPVTLAFDATGLAEGVYNGSITINSDDSTNPAIIVPLTMTVTASVDLGLTKQADLNPVYVGDVLTYTLTVVNSTMSTASGVIVSDPLPANLTYISATATQGVCDFDGTTVSCNLGSLGAGLSADVTIEVTVDAAGPLVNQASVTGNEIDPNPANNNSSHETIVLEIIGYLNYMPIIQR
jgi:uncharacterized repeat protein (TIGR01451 family)